MHKQRLAVVISGGVGVIATFLPWVSVSMGFLGNYSVSGISIWPGMLTFLACVGAGVLAVLGADRTKPIEANYVKFVVIAGAVPFIIIVLNMLGALGSGGLGIGVYLAILATAAIVAVPFVVKDNGDISMPNKQSITDEFNQMRND
jgi:hypothetical protein